MGAAACAERCSCCGSSGCFSGVGRTGSARKPLLPGGGQSGRGDGGGDGEPPVRVAVAGAAGQIGYALLPMIAKGDIFGPTRRVILQCLDLNQVAVVDAMRAVDMELQDGNFPLLQEASFTVDEAKAFQGADYAILLGGVPPPPPRSAAAAAAAAAAPPPPPSTTTAAMAPAASPAASPAAAAAGGASEKEAQEAERERKETLEKNLLIFRTLGKAIDQFASRNCKVLVSAPNACVNALLCAYSAPSLPQANFFGLSRLEHNRAVGLVARRARASPADVRNVVVWGSTGTPPDLEHTMVRGRPLLVALSTEEDRRWLRERFTEEALGRGAAIQKARRAGAALSAARAIVDHLRDLHFGTPAGEVTSMGVWSDGNDYGVAEGLVFSFPVICTGGGRFRIAPALRISGYRQAQLREAERMLLGERELIQELASKHGLAT